MINLDYLLYDNRTWSSRWGRDWGLKAATGVLVNRADLRADFDRYCGALPGEQGQLAGFAAAIGGVRSRMGAGYLLCVTVGSSDSFGRPSWAVFGLWCPDLPTLDTTLRANPVSSARALLRTEPPPTAFAVRPGGTPIQPLPLRRTTLRPSFHRFQKGRSADEVSSILLGCIHHGMRLPNVLGITASSRLSAVARNGFDIVYCHPVDDKGERALARAQGSCADGTDQPTARPRSAPSHDLATQSRPVRQFRIPRSFMWSAAISAAIAAFIVGNAMVETLTPEPESREAVLVKRPSPATPPPSIKPAPIRKVRAGDKLLADVRESLEELKNLEPDALRRSTGFVKATTLTLRPEHASDQKKAVEAFDALIEIRNRLLQHDPEGYLAFYFDEEGNNPSIEVATKLKKISRILRKHSLGTEPCKTIRDDFGFEFDDEGSAVRQWCDTLTKLNETKRALGGE